jgi:hypothetical protein
MGWTSYNTILRSSRSDTLGYGHKSADELFTQNKVREIHQDMDPKDVKYREACDSENHPKTVPVQLWMDVTGSMGSIPLYMVREGLPKLVGNLIQKGVKDVTLMFGGVGDHECDRYPLQVGQFESGDAELDMWLTRTYLEGGGGGNTGESYLLAWYFSAFHTKIDSFDKRGKKGFVFTFGDEPCLKSLPMSAIKSIMGNTATGQETYSREQLLTAAQEKNNVFHIHVNHGGYSRDSAWREMLGKNLIVVDDYKTVSDVITKTILDTIGNDTSILSLPDDEREKVKPNSKKETTKPEMEMML